MYLHTCVNLMTALKNCSFIFSKYLCSLFILKQTKTLRFPHIIVSLLVHMTGLVCAQLVHFAVLHRMQNNNEN